MSPAVRLPFSIALRRERRLASSQHLSTGAAALTPSRWHASSDIATGDEADRHGRPVHTGAHKLKARSLGFENGAHFLVHLPLKVDLVRLDLLPVSVDESCEALCALLYRSRRVVLERQRQLAGDFSFNRDGVACTDRKDLLDVCALHAKREQRFGKRSNQEQNNVVEPGLDAPE